MLAAFWALIFLRNIKANDDVALVTHYPDKGDTCAKINAQNAASISLSNT